MAIIAFANLSTLVHGQQWIRGEYFIDTDPGVSKSINNIAITSTEQTKDEIIQNFEIDLPKNITSGFHTLGFRILGLSGDKVPKKVWSTTEFRTFYVSPPVSPTFASKLDSVQYFFDQDQGVNYGSPFGNTKPTVDAISSDGYEIPVNKLRDGFHSLGLRVRNSAGVWSLIEYRTFYIPTIKNIFVNDIIAAHYFIDQDSSITSRNNKAIDVSKATNVNGEFTLPMFEADIANLSKGFHNIGIRVKNSLGQWSLLDYRTFYIAPSASERVTPKLVSAEYFIDADLKSNSFLQPIVTKKFAPVDTVNFADEAFDVSGLEFGKHTVSVRVKDEKGNYSFFKDTTFTVTECLVFPVADVSFKANTKSASTLGMCLPDTGIFIANVKGGNAETTYSWDFDGDGKIDDATKGNVKYTYTKTGTFKAMLTTSNGGKCFSKDSVMVTIDNKPPSVPKITLRNDTLISNLTNNILWYDRQGKLIIDVKGAIYSPLIGGTYYATQGNAKGCESDTSIGVKYIPTLPTASIISRSYSVTDGDPVNIEVTLTGTAPWTLYSKFNNNALPAVTVTRKPFNWQVFAAGTYALDSVVDGKARKGKVAGLVTVIVKQFQGAIATTPTKEYILKSITDTAQVKISLRGLAPFTLYLSYENVERVINDIRDTAYVFKTFQQGSFKLTRVFDATGNAGKATGLFSVRYQSAVSGITASISSKDTLVGNAPADVILNFTGKAPWTALWSIDYVPFPTPLVIRKSPDTIKVFKDGTYRLLTVIDGEGNKAELIGFAKVVKPAIPLYTGVVSGNGSLNESDTVYISFKYNGNIPWTLIYGNDLGFVDTVVVAKNEYLAKVYNRGIYRIIKIIDGKANIQSEIVFKGEAKVELELVTKEGFSPNNDGLNERFEFKGLSLFESNKLFIYNREGQAVYSSENYQNDWDGKANNGKPAPDGVYYFTLKSSNTSGKPEPLETYGYIEVRR